MTHSITKTSLPVFHPVGPRAFTLQRKCDCGTHTVGGGKCSACSRDEQRQGRAGGSALIVSDPADALEREADRMAEYVVGSGGHLPSTGHMAPAVQRQADSEGFDEVDDEDEDMDDDSAPDLAEEPELVGDASGRPKLEAEAGNRAGRHRVAIPDGAGVGMEQGVRSLMERRFAHDFSGVRVHTDSAAARSARQLHAQAYTIGTDIYFNQGRYKPDSLDGRRLLAHELTHVVQQTGGAPLALQRAPGKGFKRPKGPHDAPLGKPKGRKRSKSGPVPCAKGACGGTLAQAVEKAVRHPWCGNETCSPGPAANANDFIRHLDVNLTTQMVTAEIGTSTKTNSTKVLLSSPNPTTTPKGTFKIGRKCGPCHTNMSGHGMGWFSGFHNELEFGFHNSQTVAKGVHSLACVRTLPGDAKWIHDNSASGITTVCVHTGNHCGASEPVKPKRRPAGGGSGTANQAPRVTEALPPAEDDTQDDMVA